MNRRRRGRGPRTGGYVNYGPREPKGQQARESGSLEKINSAEAEQKRKEGDCWDRVEGRIESLLQGRLRSRDRGGQSCNEDRKGCRETEARDRLSRATGIEMPASWRVGRKP